MSYMARSNEYGGQHSTGIWYLIKNCL